MLYVILYSVISVICNKIWYCVCVCVCVHIFEHKCTIYIHISWEHVQYEENTCCDICLCICIYTYYIK